MVFAERGARPCQLATTTPEHFRNPHRTRTAVRGATLVWWVEAWRVPNVQPHELNALAARLSRAAEVGGCLTLLFTFTPGVVGFHEARHTAM